MIEKIGNIWDMYKGMASYTIHGNASGQPSSVAASGTSGTSYMQQSIQYPVVWTIEDPGNNKRNIVLCTTNNTRNNKGHLIMGAGTAKTALSYVPELAETMGKLTNESADYFLRVFPLYGIGCLQTKRNWRDPSDILLVKESIIRLYMMAEIFPETSFHLPRPGCGNGNLVWDQVFPICKILPDNCYVWHYHD